MKMIFFLRCFSFLFFILLLSCSGKQEDLTGFAVIPGNADSRINSMITEKPKQHGNFICAYSEKATLSEIIDSLSGAGCSKIIIRGEALAVSGYSPAVNAVIIDPPPGICGFKFDAEYALKCAGEFYKKKFKDNRYALILPDNDEFRIIADKYFKECRNAVFLKNDYGSFDAFELENALSRLQGIKLIIHYSGYSSERIKSFCSENGIYSASVFSDLETDSTNLFSAEKDYVFAGEYAFNYNHGNESVVMPSGCVKLREYSGK
ncbi:MAG: hypothetical protein KA015_01250 [Spirochaetes bacterium]|nr:hypothetical protein [Spirochaetota bacterium]